jgi:hypothetical protein
MTWAKVFVLDVMVDWGFNIVMSDVDVVWFKDPLPLFSIHKDAGKSPKSPPSPFPWFRRNRDCTLLLLICPADLMFSTDVLASSNDLGDNGLEKNGNPQQNYNTGELLVGGLSVLHPMPLCYCHRITVAIVWVAGVYLMRNNKRTIAWAHAWRNYFNTCNGHDQVPSQCGSMGYLEKWRCPAHPA